MEQLFSDPSFCSGNKIQLVEVHMDKMDIPWRLGRMIATATSKIQHTNDEIKENGKPGLNGIEVSTLDK